MSEMNVKSWIELLGRGVEAPEGPRLDKQGWIAILQASGMDESDMHRWHVEFERLAPDAHHGFLVSLGIDPRRSRASARRRARPRASRRHDSSQDSNYEARDLSTSRWVEKSMLELWTQA